jgi:TetR/AcrR family transcriptional regulator, fatty acid metabolism regulator protein
MATGLERPEEARGDRQAERRESTRRRIIDAAMRVFSEKGYHDTAVDDIVRACDSSKGAVYFHFPNKQGIFLSLVEHLAGQLIDRMEGSISSERGGIAKVDAALRTVLTSFASHRSLARILLVEVVGLGHGFDPRLYAVRARFTEAIKKHLDRAVEDGAIPPQDTEIAARVWLGALNEVVARWLYADPAESLEDSLPALRLLLLRSVGYSPTDEPSAVSFQPSVELRDRNLGG